MRIDTQIPNSQKPFNVEIGDSMKARKSAEQLQANKLTSWSRCQRYLI